MTVPLTGNRQTFAGSGSSGPFPVTAYGIFKTTDVQVTLKTDADGTFVSKALTTDYTVTITDPANLPSTFTINWAASSTNPAVGETVIADLFIPFTQLLEYKRRGKFPAEANEEGLDRSMTGLAQLAGPLGLISYNVQQTDFMALDSTSLDKWGGDGKIAANFLPGVLGTDLATVDQLIIAALADVPLAQNNVLVGNASNQPISTTEAAFKALYNLVIGTDLQAQSVNLDEIAAIANVRGDILFTNTTPEWARLAVGTVGQILSSDGLDPSWNSAIPALAVPAGNRVLLASATASGDSSIDFTTGLDSTYDVYELEFYDVFHSAAGIGNVRLSIDGGSTFIISGYNFNTHIGTAGSGSTVGSFGTTSGTEFNLADIDNDSNGRSYGKFVFTSPDLNTFFNAWWNVAAPNAVGNSAHSTGAGQFRTSGDNIDAIQYLPSTGTITAGEFRLYGIKK